MQNLILFLENKRNLIVKLNFNSSLSLSQTNELTLTKKSDYRYFLGLSNAYLKRNETTKKQNYTSSLYRVLEVSNFSQNTLTQEK